MRLSYRESILLEVGHWPDVEIMNARSDTPQVVLGKIELGHLHGSSVAHVPFPRTGGRN